MECRGELQCLRSVCVPRCVQDVECGEGYLCAVTGECRPVPRKEGDLCLREQDCGRGYACMLSEDDKDDKGRLTGRCWPENSDVGRPCSESRECRAGLCVDGLCSQLCLDDIDCPLPHSCEEITVRVHEEIAFFQGCHIAR